MAPAIHLPPFFIPSGGLSPPGFHGLLDAHAMGFGVNGLVAMLFDLAAIGLHAAAAFAALTIRHAAGLGTLCIHMT